MRRGLVAVAAAALVVPASSAGDPAKPRAETAASSGTIVFYRFPKLLDSRGALKRARGSCRICGVYTMHGDGRAEKPVPHLSGRRLDLIANDLRWSPDGRRLAAVRTGGLHENNLIELYTVARDGSDRRTVAISRTEEGAIGHGGWSPDGTQLVYTRGLDVVVGEARGGPERKLDRRDLQTLAGPDWSPDGTQIAAIGIRSGPGGVVSGLWLVDLATSGLTNVVEWQDTGGPTAIEPSTADWAPAGTTIAVKYGTRAGGGGILLVDAATHTTRTLMTAPNTAELPSDMRWSPDGQWIALDQRVRDSSSVVAVPVAGGPPLTVPNASTPAWSPDGRRIAFVRRNDIWSIQTSGGGLKRLTRGPDEDGNSLDWSAR